MATILYYLSYGLAGIGILCTLVFAWFNTFAKKDFAGADDIKRKNKSLVNDTITCLIFAIVFAFFSCILSGYGTIAEAIARTAQLYMILAIISFSLIIAYFFINIFLTVTKKSFIENLMSDNSRLFKGAMICGIVCGILAWLLGR